MLTGYLTCSLRFCLIMIIFFYNIYCILSIWPHPFLETFFLLSVCLVAKSCQTLLPPVGCSPPGSSVHEISQARILEWLAISFSNFLLYPFLNQLSSYYHMVRVPYILCISIVLVPCLQILSSNLCLDFLFA